MREFMLGLIVLSCMAIPARAQHLEFFGGYSYAHVGGSNYQNTGLNGWNAAASAYIGSLGVVADFSKFYGAGTSTFTPIGSNGHGATFLFGPQYSFRWIPHVTPFVHVMMGAMKGARYTVGPLGPGGVCPAPGCSGSLTVPDTAFTTAIGGGIDVKLRNHIWIRAIQLDYLRANFTNNAVNTPRVSVGLVYRFGKT